MGRSGDVSRRRFLHGAALSGAAAFAGGSAGIPGRASATGSEGTQAVGSREVDAGGRVPNPIVPAFEGRYGIEVPDFDVPKRPMGKTGLQVSIIGMGGFHLGTAAGQQEVNNWHMGSTSSMTRGNITKEKAKNWWGGP